MTKFIFFLLLHSYIFLNYSHANVCSQLLNTSPDKLSLITESQKFIALQPLTEFIRKELKSYSDKGNKKFLTKNNEFIFKNSMEQLTDASGITREAVYKAHHNGIAYIIKKLSRHSSALPALPLKEIQNAKIMAILGLGPKTDFVIKDGAQYLVMTEASGINIKEIFNSFTEATTTKIKIAQMLSLEPNDAKIFSKFARTFLNSPGVIKQLFKIQSVLEENNFAEIRDFQFMINLKEQEYSLSVIDVASFRRFRANPDPNYTPESVINGLIQRLNEIADSNR